ncbi:hypothetical protein OG301_39445 (plasmid) [Streptomyces platensis]|uniref:hypothetical protein n=1 Tax=Streptomyces platensis TaxID=58346 RepID=UPI002ED5C3A0|nr:hypothetical protein OG301_39445 [Streptomyces platensis]
MPNGTQAPATAEGPTQHTQNQDPPRPAGTYGYTRAEQIEALHRLREAFTPQEIRYLPRVWCGQCKGARGGCSKHPASKCGKCNQNMPKGGHIDLAFVGHAEATNRLLNVDPFWDWVPLTTDERGLPQMDGYSGLWIRLTVCGMTRLGYGHANGKTGGDSIKEIIGDAIRNAGMRFGMALDLWTSSDLEKVESDSQGAEVGATQDEQPRSEQRDTRPAPAPQQNAPAAAQEAQEPTASTLNQLYWQAVEQFKSPRPNLDAITQIRGAAEAHSVIDDEVTGPPPAKEPMTFRDFLDLLDADAAAKQERNAA